MSFAYKDGIIYESFFYNHMLFVHLDTGKQSLDIVHTTLGITLNFSICQRRHQFRLHKIQNRLKPQAKIANPEIIKFGKPTLPKRLLGQCWEELTKPQDMGDADIAIMLKPCRNIPSNYGWQTLCPIIIFQKLADRIYSDLQCRFRSSRSAMDRVFSLVKL